MWNNLMLLIMCYYMKIIKLNASIELLAKVIQYELNVSTT